jgi:hypothetical protein
MVKVPSIQHLKGINILEKSLILTNFFALIIVGYDESDLPNPSQISVLWVPLESPWRVGVHQDQGE